jgi:hypothetical protein
MHMMFNFHVNQHLFYALASADSRPLAKALADTRPRPATAQWGSCGDASWSHNGPAVQRFQSLHPPQKRVNPDSLDYSLTRTYHVPIVTATARP